MSLQVMASGILSTKPKIKTSSNGNLYSLRKKQTRIKNAIEEDTDPNDDISHI